MVTNQIMTRELDMGKYKVLQRTSDGFFNASALLDAWNNGGNTKEIDKFLKIDTTQSLIDEIKNREGNSFFGGKYGKSNFQVVTHSKQKPNGKGRPKDVLYMHPVLFIDFAMWLSPKFRYDVIKFCYDKMVEYRKDAGDAYRRMSEAVAMIVKKEFLRTSICKVSEAVNWIVFNNHYENIRNDHGTEEKMKELYEMEKRVADLISDGFIHSYDELIKYLRELYQRKYTPKALK